MYCSPSCGFGCTHEAFRRATLECDALVARMGQGWTPRVWENCGWRYAAKFVFGDRTVAEIRVNTTGSHIEADWTVVGHTAVLWTVRQMLAHAKEPEDALGFLVQDAGTESRRIADDLALLDPNP